MLLVKLKLKIMSTKTGGTGILKNKTRTKINKAWLTIATQRKPTSQGKAIPTWFSSPDILVKGEGLIRSLIVQGPRSKRNITF